MVPGVMIVCIAVELLRAHGRELEFSLHFGKRKTKVHIVGIICDGVTFHVIYCAIAGSGSARQETQICSWRLAHTTFNPLPLYYRLVNSCAAFLPGTY